MSEVIHQTPNQQAWLRFKRNRPAMLGLGFFLLVLSLILLGPVLLPYDPDALSDFQFAAPDSHHWFGTDVHGRDLLARIIVGARISLLVGAVGAGVSLVIGATWGAVAGYAGGRLDSWMMRAVDVLYCLPNIVFVIVLITTLEDLVKRLFGAGSGVSARLLLLFVGLGAISWLTMARVVRGQVLSLRTRQFVDASRALGATHARILWH